MATLIFGAALIFLALFVRAAGGSRGGGTSASLTRLASWGLTAGGIVVLVQALDASDWKRTQASTFAELELEGRMKIYGGAFKRRRVDKVSFLLPQQADAEAQAYCAGAGTIDQVSPSVP